MNMSYKILHNIINIGFFISWMSMLFGILITFLTVNTGNKFKGTLLGFIGGLLLSVVCFDLIPDAFQNINIVIGIMVMLLGLTFSAILDGFLQKRISKSNKNKSQRLYKAAIFMIIGVGIDNFPSGIALGSLYDISPIKGMQLAFILFIHSIPEGISIGYFLKESNKGFFMILTLSIIASIPMDLGYCVGMVINRISPMVDSLSLAFASGLMLYIVFRETIDESRKIWTGRLSSIGNVLGIIAGFISVTLIH
jgi:ZIP family zinc transporter